MKYKNAKDIFPDEILREIMKYVDGQYIYIPKKKENNDKVITEYRQEIDIRNSKIYEHYLIGMKYSEIAKMYCLSEKSVRRIVLNEKKKMKQKQVSVQQVMTKYGIEGDIKQIYSTAWNIGDEFVLKKYVNFEELKRNVDVLSILYSEQIPVPKIIATSNNEKYLKDKENYWLLTTKLKGYNIVNVNKCNEQWFFKMGKIIARLHLAFDECEGKIKCWNNSLLGEMESWIRKNIYEYDKKIIDKNEFEDIIKELRLVDKDLSYGLIHRDVHLGNFLFYNNEFSGYVDFDLSQKNIRIFDLCYFMLGLLLEDEENKVDETQWFQYLKNLVKGYASVIPISIIERKSIPLVMECIELLFVAYFIGEKDERAMRDSLKLYEFCKDNCNKIKASVQL